MSQIVRDAADRAMELFRGEDPRKPGLKNKWAPSIRQASREKSVSTSRIENELEFRRRHFGTSKKKKQKDTQPKEAPKKSEVQGTFDFPPDTRDVMRRMLGMENDSGASGGVGGASASGGTSGSPGGSSALTGQGNSLAGDSEGTKSDDIGSAESPYWIKRRCKHGRKDE